MRAIRELYPNHEEQLNRLSKVEGQLRGVRRMIEDRRYCIDIVSQIKAVNAALKQVQTGVLEKHIHHCVAESVTSRRPELFEEKVTEIIQVLGRMD